MRTILVHTYFETINRVGSINLLRHTANCHRMPCLLTVKNPGKWSRIHESIRILSESYSIFSTHVIIAPCEHHRNPFIVFTFSNLPILITSRFPLSLGSSTQRLEIYPQKSPMKPQMTLSWSMTNVVFSAASRGLLATTQVENRKISTSRHTLPTELSYFLGYRLTKKRYW